MPALMVGLLGRGVKVLLTGATVQVEAGGRGSYEVQLPLQRGHLKVGKVTYATTSTIS